MAKAKKSKLVDGQIEYGDVELTDEEYQEAQNPNVRTTMFLEADLIRAYKKEALARGVRYQQLMREVLHQGLSGSLDLESRLKRLEETVYQQKKRA